MTQLHGLKHIVIEIPWRDVFILQFAKRTVGLAVLAMCLLLKDDLIVYIVNILNLPPVLVRHLKMLFLRTLEGRRRRLAGIGSENAVRVVQGGGHIWSQMDIWVVYKVLVMLICRIGLLQLLISFLRLVLLKPRPKEF